MSPDGLSRLSALLDVGFDLSGAAREAWLQSLRGDQEPLVVMLRKLLLSRDVETGDMLERGPSFAAGAGGAEAGDDVGPYRLLKEIGTGGMGAVWLAERSDGALKRKVALKLPHVGWAPGLADRFEREREILGSLEHAHIARLYDAGLDARGRPYMALEYVEGVAIDAYCRDRRLGIAERLALLLQVSDAVAFAHARLVLHRDLKPGNILVTAQGEVRLLDFGIAKLMAGELTRETALTQAAGRALTLDYASPEQIRGEAVGTASDVYSLGVVAYELLTEARPYKLKRGSAAELEEAIAAQDVPLASSAASDPQRARLLKGDLDAILNRALKKNAADRYPTIDALAQDWQRYLEGRRVLARPDTLRYRASRFAVRHRVPLLALTLGVGVFALAVGLGEAAVVIAALVVGLGAAVLQARRATRDRDRAVAMANRNAAVNEFLETLITRAARAGPQTAEQLLERSERLVDGEIKGNAEHRAYVLGVLANCYTSLDDRTRAAQLLARATDAARGIGDAALRDSLLSRQALARGSLDDLGGAREAIDALLRRRHVTPEVRSEAHGYASILASQDGDSPAALHHASEALRWYRASRLLPKREEIKLLGNLGWAHVMHGRGDEADRHFASAMKISEDLGMEDSPQASSVISTWALAVQEMGDLPKSLELFDRGMAISNRAAPGSLPSPRLVVNRAYTLMQMGRYAEAEAGYALGAESARHQESPILVYLIRACAIELQTQQGMAADGARALAAADAELGSEPAPDSPGDYIRNLTLARLALLRGEAEAAISTFTVLVEGDTASASSAGVMLDRSAAHLQAGQLQAAESDARQALQMAQRLQGRKPASFRTGLAWLAIARARQALGDAAAASRHAAAALAQLRPTLDASHPALAEARRLQSAQGVPTGKRANS